MDILLSKVTQQAMNYAIRSGIAITSGYALSQCSRLMKTQEDGKERDELARLQRRLDSKIRIISPAIDMIELITARGNTSLESCVSLTKALRLDIQNLGLRLANAATDEEDSRRKSSKTKSKQQRDLELRLVVADMKALLERIEDAVPLINLAITTSGVSLSTSLPASISPSRLLQASTFLSAGDVHYATDPSKPVQIGPTFTLSMYMLFSGHAHGFQDDEGLRNATWQEVIHKTRLKLVRTVLAQLGQLSPDNVKQSIAAESPSIEESNQSTIMSASASADEFAYQLNLVEDLDDGRHHGDVEANPCDGVAEAGIREAIPIHQISKIFYADTGKILNIGNNGEMNNPVLLLKRDLHATPPRRMLEQDWAAEDGTELDNVNQALEKEEESVGDAPEETATNCASWHLPPGLDPEWVALEVLLEDSVSDTESESESEDVDSSPGTGKPQHTNIGTHLVTKMSSLRLSSSPALQQGSPVVESQLMQTPEQRPGWTSKPASFPLGANANIRTSLSLLEMLIRLTSLQQFQQASHLTINDELLNFFLEESSTTGAASGDTDERKRIRMEARQRVGFDPYDESPIKRRGEDYQHREHRDESEVGQTDGFPSRPSRESTPNSSVDSPLLLRSREHSSQSRIGTPERRTEQRTSSSPMPKTPKIKSGRQSHVSLVTPPGTTKSRESFLRDEAARNVPNQSSPLARHFDDDPSDE